MKKRSISLILAIVFSLSIVLNTAQPSLALSTDQSGALDAYYKILSSFGWKSGKPVYPDDYGGEYIDGSLLYVWIVHKNPMNQRKYEQLCEGSEYVRFLDAAYSLNELERLADDLMISGKDYNISGHYVDRVNNKLCMCVAPQGYEMSESKYAGLSYEKTVTALTIIWREYLDRIVFCEQEYLELSSVESGDNELVKSLSNTSNTELIGGAKIQAKDDVSNAVENKGTLGFCGTYSKNNTNFNAVLTAGHVIREAQGLGLNVISLYHTTVAPWNKFAMCDFYKLGDYEYENGVGSTISNSDGDFAICKKLQNTYSLTNKVKFSTGTINIVGTILEGWLPAGTYVSCYGSATYYHIGIVSSLNACKVTGSRISISGLVMVSMPGIATGDSGGPVYTYTEAYSQTYGFAEGTICGKTTNYMYYSPISYAMSSGFSVATS